MIKKVEMYTVICDNCGKDSNADSEYSCWGDDLYAEEVAMEFDWQKEDEKHYCTDCFEFDEDDNLIIKIKGSS
jgi:hypothetical protein